MPSKRCSRCGALETYKTYHKCRRCLTEIQKARRHGLPEETLVSELMRRWHQNIAQGVSRE